MSVVDGNEWESLKRFNLEEIYQPSPKGISQAIGAGVSKEESQNEADATTKLDISDETPAEDKVERHISQSS